jgi:hypothetical protein
MWNRLRPALLRIWQRMKQGSSERRTREARGRFWAEVNEGRLEAESASTPQPLQPVVKR